jgi:phage N-6-adenine-methyltransferase
MGSHESNTGGTDQWVTPRSILDALGVFDLDPCAPINRPWPTAHRHYTIVDDGLRQPWNGRVWLNPPYSTAARWLARLAQHGQGTALLFARTETRLWFQHVWPRASGILFMRGRVTFCYPDGRPAAANSGAPSALVAYGQQDARVLAAQPLPGKYLPIPQEPP